ncbi:MAG: single-stranded DNA-binding protein, partial [Pseudonocardiaceae bacterium]
LAKITLVGLLVTDPELHITSTGAVARFTVAADERRFDPTTSQWVDTTTTLLPCSIGHHAAGNVAGSLTKGTRVLITGVLRQREWETTDGDKRYAYEVHATEVGVSLTDAMVQVTSTDTSSDS